MKIKNNNGKFPLPENIIWIDRKNFPIELIEKSQIQNILSWDGLAERVVGMCEYEGAVCQIIEENEVIINDDKVKELSEKYSFDVNTWKFTKSYTDTVKQIYFVQGKYGKIYYQNIPELELNGGPRQSLDRINYMKLNDVDFKNKTVIDIGCAGGFFCRYADDHGAASVLGVDMPDTVIAAKHTANLLGNFKINYVSADLSKGYDAEIPYDIAFFLSMIYHIATPKVVYKAKKVIFEDNGKTTRHKRELNKPWTDHFSKIAFVGRGLDHGDKALYHLEK